MGSNFKRASGNDLLDESSFAGYVASQQSNPEGPLITTASWSGEPQYAATSFTVSDILQGNFNVQDPSDSMLIVNKALSTNLKELYNNTPASSFGILGSGPTVIPLNPDIPTPDVNTPGLPPDDGSGTGDPPVTSPPITLPSGAVIAPNGRQNQTLPDGSIGHRAPPYVAAASTIPGFVWNPVGTNKFSGEPVQKQGLTYAAYQFQQALWNQFPLLKGHLNYQVERQGKTAHGTSGKWSPHAYGSALDLMLSWMGSDLTSEQAYARQIYLWVIQAAARFPQIAYVLYNYRIWNYGDAADRHIKPGTLAHTDHVHVSCGQWG